MGTFDTQKMDVPCQKCGHKMSQTIAALQRNPLLTCPNCKTQTQVKADDLKRSLDQVERALNDLKRKFR